MTEKTVSNYRPDVEAAIQCDIIRTLERFGVWLDRYQSGMLKVGGRWIRCGKKGAPDLIILDPPGWLEVKRPGHELRPHQAEWHERARKAGHRVATVHSAKEALDVVLGWRREESA